MISLSPARCAKISHWKHLCQNELLKNEPKNRFGFASLSGITELKKTVKNKVPEFRVARFFLLQNTKTGKNIPNYHKIYQMAIEYFQWP
jgi:hypothetical protein